jgi:hypothetical protein
MVFGMDEKDWTLKDKGVWRDYRFKMEDHWYSASDIEILRQKLIEDMENAWSKLCGSDDKMKYRFINAWRTSINRRFGFEE